MSILIKGMEMPKNCCQCIHTVWNGRDDVCRFSGISALNIGRQSDCPLIEVSEDVQPVKHGGKWVNDIQCSNCGWYMEDDVTMSPMIVFFDYCPNCGARMDG